MGLPAVVVLLTASHAPAQTVPAGWTVTNVGNPSPAGSATEANGTFTIEGSGTRDSSGMSEAFLFVHRQVTGDVTLVARVLSFNSPNAGRAGVMIREALTTTAPYAMGAVTTNRRAQLVARTPAGQALSYQTSFGGWPQWIRLERHGATVSVSRSSDGVSWTLVHTTNVGLAAAVHVGLAVTSRTAGTLATATFDNVSISGPATADTTPPSVTITAPANNSQVTGSVAISANASDNVGVASVSFRVDGAALGTPDTSAPYGATWNATPGQHVLTAEAIDAAGNRTTSSPVSVTVPSPNQSPTVALTAPADGATYTAPASIQLGANAADPDGSVAQVEFYAGQTLLGTDASAPYAFAWTNAPEGTYALTAVARDQQGATATSASRTVTVGAAPAVQWTTTNVGDPMPVGSVNETTGTFTIEGSGARDMSGMSEEFMFMHRQVTGDATLVARVTSFNGPSTNGRAGLMVREALTTTSSHAMVAVTPDRRAQFVARSAAGESWGMQSTFAAWPQWLRLERRGATVTAFHSIDGATWTQVHSANVGLTSTLHVGLAVTSRSAGALATATFDSVTVTGDAPGGGNQPPTVALTGPPNGSTYTAPASIPLTANAADAEGAIARVDFRAGSTLVGSDTTSPFAFTWSGVAAGTYALTAVAYDSAGQSTTSSPVTVTVSAAQAPPTRAVFNASSNHTAAVQHYLLEIFTAGADPQTATPVQTQNLGKPSVPDGAECSVDIAATISALPGGTYIATVTAVGAEGSARSSPSAPFSR